MKKVITVVFAAVAALVAAPVLLAAVYICIFIFSPPDSMSRVKNVQNVYYEVWNLMSDECRGKKTVLSSATPEAYRDFDLWEFNGVRIPEHEISLVYMREPEGQERLHIYVNWCSMSDESISYYYDTKTKLLTGEKEEAYLLENFLKLYFEWREDGGHSSDYSMENLGEYTFEIINE